MKIGWIVVLLVGVGVITSIVTYMVHTSSTIEKVEIVDVVLMVDSKVGLNADTDRLYFGTVPPYAEGIRDVSLTNDADYPLTVYLTAHGDIKDWIRFSHNGFVMQPHSERNVSVVGEARTEEFGEYTAQIRVEFHK